MAKRKRYNTPKKYRYTDEYGREKALPADIEADVWRGGQSYGELQELRRRLAKRANQRLVRLERATSDVTGESYASYGAADIAYEYLQQQGRNRFSEVMGKDPAGRSDVNALRREITTLQSFLSAKSSTVAGQREIEKKRMSTFETGGWGKSGKGAPLQFSSNKDFYDFLNSSAFRELSGVFDSDQIVEIYDKSRALHNGEHEETMRIMNKTLYDFRHGRIKTNLKNLQRRMGVKII